MSPADVFNRLLVVGGYPEPFLNGSESEYRRWRQTHLDKVDLKKRTQILFL